ncbi:GRIP and coiled-coil domain-containing protein 2 isoform X2 [Latimeria chalumnae]|uniref:GRIP and coiled-coil domain-containing protein 2 isoform X2 n=1 Tax=Latimeria chalumnae TaxID=7897 RepID=UPI00313B9AA3
MSGTKETSCRKFQPNIFNKSKCQNCFKAREQHLLSHQDFNQAKPIYGGWLCLAPEGTDFDNPMQRSRKWQRRFFVLYEHGCLRFALDESPTTLPQGTVNMNQCSDVIDAEPKTGQKNALCIITPEREYFIRGESKEIINGWFEQLVLYPRTNKQNQKKKRKVEPTSSQNKEGSTSVFCFEDYDRCQLIETYYEPGPAKVAVTGSGIPEPEKILDSRSTLWQEELLNLDVASSSVWPQSEGGPQASLTVLRGGDIVFSEVGSDHSSYNGDEVDRGGPTALQRQEICAQSPAGSTTSRYNIEAGGIPRCPSPAHSDPFPSGSSLLSNGSHMSGSMSSLDSEASGSTVTSTESHLAEFGAQRTSAVRDILQVKRLSCCDSFENEVRGLEKQMPATEGAETRLEQGRSRSTVIEKFEALDLETAEKMEMETVEESASCGTRQGRSESRRFQKREEAKIDSAQGSSFLSSTIPPFRRAKSLDRRTTESIMTPDLLNFKKGWMVKLDKGGQWKKYWFVLTDHSLRYYKDSIAEEASDLDGEIDLTTCYSVTEYQVQRNYGFQIHTGEAVFTLSAMTGGIRRNWIQAIMKNVHPSTAPDVASSAEEQSCTSLPDRNLRPDVKSDFAPVPDSIQDKDGGQQKSRVRERRRDGRSKTFDWAEFRPIAQALAQQRALETEFLPVEVTHWDKTKQCEDRQKRYEIVAGAHPGEGSRMELDGALPTVTFERQQKMQDEIEQHWQQVEQTPIREERRVPLATVLPNSSVVELEKLLEEGGKEMEELRSLLERTQQELEESHRYRHEIEAQLNAALEREQNVLTGYISPLEPSLVSSTTWQQLQRLNQDLEAKLEAQRRQQEAANLQAQNLTKTYQEAREVIQQQSIQIQSFQTRLELFVSQAAFNDQTLANVQNQLFMERQRNKDQADELEGKVSMFNSQLRDNEERLKEAESQLLEKSQALRDLERQMALQRNHQREVRRLQEHLDDANKRLLEREQGVIVTEERFQKLCESAKEQQEKKVLKEKLIKAEEKERECTMRLQAMEAMLDMAQKEKLATSLKSSEMVRQMEEHVELSEVTVKKLAQDIEILSTENERLNQRYQELANQLTEADREIERLKANLILKQEGQCNLLDDYEIAIEEGKRLKDELRKSEQNLLDKKDLYERELEKKNWELHEASSELEALRRSLGKTEKKLQLKEATLKGLGFQLPALDEIDQLKEEKLLLLAELEDTKVRLLQQESRLQVAEHSSVELQSLNNELKLKLQTAKQHYGQQIPKAEKKPQRLQEELSNLNKTFLLSARHELKEETTASREYQQVLKSSELTLSSDKSPSIIEELSEEERIQLLVSKLSLESKALNKVANTLLNMDSNVVRTLQEFKRYTESTQSPPMFSADSDVLIEQSALRKILLEGQFWASVSNISDSRTSALEEHTSEFINHFLGTVAESTIIKGEILYLVHGVFGLLNDRLRKLEFQLVEVCEKAAKYEERLNTVVGAYRTSRLDLVMEELRREISRDKGSAPVLPSWNKIADIETDNSVRTELAQDLQRQVRLLNQITTSIQSTSDNELRLLALKLADSLDWLPLLSKQTDTDKLWPFLLHDAVSQTQLSYVLSKIRLQHNNDITQMKNAQKWQETLETDQSGFVALLQSKYEADLKRQKEEFQEELDKLKVEMASLKHGENSAELTHIQIEGKPIDSLDKTIELQDMAAKHKKQLRELKEAYETKIEKLKCEIVKAGETLKLKTEENIKEIDSLTVCMENLQKKHEEEMKRKQEEFEMEKKGLPLRPVTELEEVMDSAKEMTTAQGPENSKSIANGESYRIPFKSADSRLSRENSECHSTVFLRDRIQELEAQISTMRLKMEQRELGHGPALKEKYEKDLENLKATCERGFAAMEESHQKVLEELQRQHQRELEKLEEEKERLLAEETAATIAAIEAMKNAHRTELEKEMERARKAQSSNENSDFDEIRKQHEEELASLHREIEVLSEQYSQKCLENAHLAQALEAERQALRQCQRENQELNAHNHELNNCLAAEITRLRSVATGEGGGDICAVTQGKEVYELEVFLRVKESEVQYLKQEINSLKDELQTAQRDKKYASDKYKDIYTELSIVKAKAERDVNRFKEQLQLAHEALGEQTVEDVDRGAYDIMKSKSNPDILKMAAATKRAERTMRSKSLKEGLTADQRFQLFDSKESKEL